MSYVWSFHLNAFLPNSPSKIKSEICCSLYFKLILFALQDLISEKLQFWWLIWFLVLLNQWKKPSFSGFQFRRTIVENSWLMQFSVWFVLIPENYGYYIHVLVMKKIWDFKILWFFQKLTLLLIFRFCNLEYCFLL